MTEDKKVPISSFRYYEKKLPDVDDFVMVKVKQVGETAAYVNLIEYNNVEGMVPFTELSRKRIRSISKHIKVGSYEVMTVIRVDKERGYVDLSKKKVSDNDLKQCEERYAHAKMVHGIMQSTIQQNPTFTMENLYTVIGWPMYRKFEHAYDGFKLALTNKEKVMAAIEITKETAPVFEALLAEIHRRMKTSAYRIIAEIEVTLYTPEGIDGIKEVLLHAETVGTEDVPIKVHIVAAPQYVVRTATMDKALGLEAVKKAVDVIQKAIVAKGGNCQIRTPEHVVHGDEDEHKVHHDETSSDDDEEEEEN
eukprot:PhF_6_TR1543/c0_g1_i1/m.2814/K03237/EIF2S1; translation initiation factor 2 subunit 1